VKRRKSLHAAPSGESSQKKPTTANRARLEAAIAEAKEHLPHVYADSLDCPEALERFPVCGEAEMLEPEEVVDLSGELRLDQDAFMNWVQRSKEDRVGYPCSFAIWRATLDQLVSELRGNVKAEDAWQLCCGSLAQPVDCKSLGTSDVAQLILYWFTEGVLPEDLQLPIYDGMLPDLEARGKTVQTAEDTHSMQSRWIRLAIQTEVEKAQHAWLSENPEAVVDLDIDGDLIQGHATSLLQEAEAVATTLKAAAEEASGAVSADVETTDRDSAEGLVSPSGPPESYGPSSRTAGNAATTAAADREAGSAPLPDLADADTSARVRVRPQTTPLRAATGPASGAGSPNELCGTGAASCDASGAAPTARGAAAKDKPLAEPAEFGDRIADTAREPYWIPGAFPTIFQNETGDPNNYHDKEVDLASWGPHVMRSKGWHAQSHTTFMYWWMNMCQRIKALSAKKWFIRDNPKSTGYTAEDLAGMSIPILAK